jgi:FkbM family methyltransferase
MLISASQLSKYWGVRPTGILHVGAHKAEEAIAYGLCGWGIEHGITWVEAQAPLVDLLRQTLDPYANRIIHATIWDIDNLELTLKISSNSESTSLLRLGTHAQIYPEITVVDEIKTKTSRLDSILDPSIHFDFVNIDIQGAELQAIKSLGDRIHHVKCVYTEVNHEDVYENCTRIEDLDIVLYELGFVRVLTEWIDTGEWGDALYTRMNSARNPLIRRISFYFLRTIKKARRKVSRMRFTISQLKT